MSELLALLDLGSNAVRMSLVKIRPGRGFTVVEEARVQTRLAGGRNGRLPGPAVHQTLRAVQAFMEPTRGRDVARVIALATAAVRDADNAEMLLGPLRRRYRLDLRILSGQEEAPGSLCRHQQPRDRGRPRGRSRRREPPDQRAASRRASRSGQPSGGSGPRDEPISSPRPAERGKEVAALVELQARFDEEANIRWARALEEVGAHVVYGLMGFQDPLQGVPGRARGDRRHPPLLPPRPRQLQRPHGRRVFRSRSLHLSRIVRGGPDRAVQPAHRLHAAHPLPSPAAGPDVAARRAAPPHPPRGRARPGRPASIVAKLNNLVDQSLIEALYEASAAGVPIELIVRGICCLRPGVAGLSDRIRVVSIIDRYLEHARVFVFDNDGAPEYLLSSADWMPRNLYRRVEIAFPVLDPTLQAEIRDILEIQLADTVKARVLLPDGRSRRRTPSEPPLRSQERLHEVVARRTR